MNRCMLLAAGALLAGAAWVPPAAAQQNVPTAAAEAPIGFAEYRDFRLQIIAQRQESVAQRLAAADLAPKDRAGLERQKAYWDRWAKMAAAERDRLFRERFEQIDSDHDGTIDAAERAAWRARQHDYYDRLAALRAGTAAPR